MSAKDFLLDKSKKVVKGTAKTGVRFAKGTVKTSKIAYDTADKLTVTGSNYVADMLINYTPDFYDEQQDVATDTGKVVGALGLQVARTGARSRRSVYNKVNKHKVKSLNRQAKFFNTTLQKKEAILQNTPELSSETKRSLQNQIRSDRRQIKRLERKTGKVQRKIREDLAFHPMQSTKAMLTNQSRKMLSTIGRGDDMGSKVVSKVGIGAWGTLKYRQRVKQTVIKTFSIVKSAVAGMIGFITSVPAMIVAVLSSVPVIIILVCVVAIFSFFGADLEYSGRVMEFSENQTRLENAYQTAIVPDEILAISQTLGWTTHKELDYEMLIALAYDGSRGTKPSFEKMMDNIFNKYNPSKHLPWGKPFNENAYTSFHYFHSQDGWFTSSVETYQMRNKEYLRLYPEYERGGETIRKNFGNAQKINELKTICRKNLENNAYNYINTFIKIDSKPNIFTSYVVSPDKISSSSPTGYRKITLNEETLTKYHYGEDIAVPKGTPVYAVMDGIVVHAQGKYKKEGKAVGLWGGGNSVIIRKDLYDAKGEPCYLYVMICHMENKSVTVKKGQKITAGTQIGTAGMTGTATGPHVHMQTWMSKKKYNSFKKGDFVYVEPQEYTRNDTADRIDIDSDDYTIYLDGTMFYDVTYRNKVYGR